MTAQPSTQENHPLRQPRVEQIQIWIDSLIFFLELFQSFELTSIVILMKLNRDFLILGRGNPSRRESSSSKREHSADHMKHLENKVIIYIFILFFQSKS